MSSFMPSNVLVGMLCTKMTARFVNYELWNDKKQINNLKGLMIRLKEYTKIVGLVKINVRQSGNELVYTQSFCMAELELHFQSDMCEGMVNAHNDWTDFE